MTLPSFFANGKSLTVFFGIIGGNDMKFKKSPWMVPFQTCVCWPCPLFKMATT